MHAIDLIVACAIIAAAVLLAVALAISARKDGDLLTCRTDGCSWGVPK